MEAIHRIQQRGISVNGCFVLGLDGQDDTIFDEVRKFVQDSHLSEVQITIQTPFPGTPLYRRLKEEGRLPQNEFWDRCTLFDVTYTPRGMSADKLESGFRDLMKDLYSDDFVRQRKSRFIKQARDFKRTQTDQSTRYARAGR